MKLLLYITITVLFFYGIFGKADKKLVPLTIVLLCMEEKLYFLKDIPFFHSARMAVLTGVMACMLYSYKESLRAWLRFPMKSQLVVMLSVSFLISIFSVAITDLQHTITIPLFEFLGSYFLLFIFYMYARENTFRTLIPAVAVCAVLLTVAGIVNLVLGFNPYILEMGRAFDIFLYQDYINSYERFRVNSLFANPFDYGYVCLTVNMLSIYCKRKGVIGPRMFALLMVCSLFGIVSCNCRTVIVAYVIGLSCYTFFSNKLGVFLKYSLAAVVLFALSYSFIEPVQTKTDQVLSIFSPHDTRNALKSGSSLEMRTRQLEGSYEYFTQSPVVGNGYNFIGKELGSRRQFETGNLNKKMWGYESVIFRLLIERGIVGILAYVFLYGGLFIYMFRNLKYDRPLAGLGIAILADYLFFAVATGELSSVPITLAFTGIIIKQIELKKLRLIACLTDRQK